MAWCKIWDSFLEDPELKEASESQRGAFVSALSLANRCRREGKFIFPDMTGAVGDRPLKREEIIKGARIREENFDWLSRKFWEHKDGVWGWKNWNSYQGDYERIRKVRAARNKSK